MSLQPAINVSSTEASPLPPIPDNITIAQLLLDGTHATDLRPERPAGAPWLIEDVTGREIELNEIRRRVFGLANALKACWEIGENDVVCIFSPNHIDYPIICWACHRLLAIPSPANPSYTPSELLHQLELSKSTLIITHSSTLKTALAASAQAGLTTDRIILIDSPPSLDYRYPTVDGLIHDGLADKPRFVERHLNAGESRTVLSYLCFSSGTTGKPKAVAIPHSSSITNVIQFSTFYRTKHYDTPDEKRLFKPGDKALAVLPLYHPYGLFLTMHMMLFNGLSVVINANSKFSSTSLLKSIQTHKITHLPIVPPQIVLMCKHPRVNQYDLTSIRMVMSSAAPLSAELTSQLIKVLPGAAIGQVYGMTETGFCSMQHPSQKIGTLGSAGRFFPGVRAKIIKNDDKGEEGEKMSGELWIGGPQICLGYEGNDTATRETWVDGWIRTGDEAIIHPNGDLFILDRIKEVLKVKGNQVSPSELEGHLLSHPSIADACVVGIPDVYAGELPFAFIVLRGEAVNKTRESPGEVRRIISEYVEKSKAPYKWLKGGIEFVDANDIARNASGKLLRRVMRDRARVMTKERERVLAKM